MNIQINTLIEWHVNEGIHPIERVLWIDESKIWVWVIDIDYKKKAWPVLRKYEDITFAITTGHARILPKVNKFLAVLAPDDDYLKKHGERGRKNYLLIAPLVEGGNTQIYNRRERGRLVTELAKLTGRRKAQINLILRRFWQGGCVPGATLPNYFRCGQGDRQYNGKKLGRPSNETRHTGEPTGRNITEEDKNRFRRGINDYVKGGKTITLKEAWQRTKENYFNLGYNEQKDGIKVPILPSSEELPTFESFKALYYKERNLKKEIITIHGEAEYESNNREILGDATLKAFGPGSIYEIDATVGDIYLLSYLDRKLIIGRPVIYFVIDVFSRLIAGFAVTLEGPSWLGAKLALENALSDKVSFCKQFGINITEEEWPVRGLCEALVGDNGEIAGYNANSLVEYYGMRVANHPPYRPDLKPVVEGSFYLLKKDNNRMDSGSDTPV